VVDTIGCREVDAQSADGYDAVVLSGGWWYDDEIQHLEIYKGELALIRRAAVPMLGICIGMQLMQIAYSGRVQLLDEPQYDLQEISIEGSAQYLLGWPAVMRVHKNHTMGALAVANGFDVLARSPGHIEMIRHQDKPLLGVQFHPEVGETEARAAMLYQLVECAQRLDVVQPARAIV
jgi:GMP synthase-like glutamine amidotransferase